MPLHRDTLSRSGKQAITKVTARFLPEQKVCQRVLQGRPAFRKFNFYADTANAKAVWIFNSLQETGDALLFGESVVKGHTAHISQELGSHCANINAFHLFQYLCI